MIADAIHPALVFFVGALLVALLPGRARGLASLAVPVFGLLALLSFQHGSHLHPQIFDHTLTLMRVDKLSLLFGYLFHIAAFLGVLYALHIEDRVQQVAALAYAGAALVAVFAGDLITLFVAWELLAVTSALLVFARRTEAAIRAGMRYLVMNVLSGVILLAGVLMMAHQSGSIAFERMELVGLGPWLILLGFGIKAGFPFFHTWITDAYPQSTPTGTVFLSAFTTKTAVYALARGFPGADVLVLIGAVMTFFPIFYAVIENDLRRVLSYSMINQIGFMVVGIGLGTELAVNGAVAHAFADVIFKGLLFMAMGAVMHRTGRTLGTDLGGLYKTMPITTVLCVIGAASISAMPLFSAFVTKSMIMTAALHEGKDWLWFLLLFASAGVLEHAGIKIPYFAFFAHDSGIRTTEPPRNMLAAMTLSALGCIAIGCFPQVFYRLLPYVTDYAPYTASHCITQIQLLAFAALAVVVLIQTGVYPPEVRSVNLDAEYLQRRLLPDACRAVGGTVLGVWQFLCAIGVATVDVVVTLAKHTHDRRGVLGGTMPIGVSAFFATAMLVIYLVLYYL